MQKICKKCHEAKPTGAFYSLGGSRKHRTQTWCIECVKARAAARYKEAPRVPFSKNPAAQEANRKYKEKNREVCAERARGYYQKNKAEIAEKRKAYEQTPHRKQMKVVHAHKRRARLLNSDDGSITLHSLQALYHAQGGKCATCEKKIDLNANRGTQKACELDHIEPIARGGRHSMDNVQWLCAVCNKRKWAHLPEVFNKQVSCK